MGEVEIYDKINTLAESNGCYCKEAMKSPLVYEICWKNCKAGRDNKDGHVVICFNRDHEHITHDLIGSRFSNALNTLRKNEPNHNPL